MTDRVDTHSITRYGDGQPLFVWKFIAPDAVTVVIASTEAEARSAVERYAISKGWDYSWLATATVRRLEIADGAVLAWAQTVLPRTVP